MKDKTKGYGIGLSKQAVIIKDLELENRDLKSENINLKREIDILRKTILELQE